MPTRITVEGVADDINQLTREVEQTVGVMTRDTGQTINQLSPVLTGFFRTNWILNFGTPRTAVRGTRDPNARYAPQAFTNAGQWRVTSGDIFFTNSVDYADVLDAGSSSQAPQGVTDPTASIIDARFRLVG